MMMMMMMMNISGL